MEEAIEITKKNIKKQVDSNKFLMEGLPFSKYQRVYLSTNENIKEYLNLVSFKNKNNALSVLGSGDHLLNLITKGISDIDTFDTNLLTTYYVFGIKYAMILKYSYKEYLNIYKKFIGITSLEELSDIINGLLPYMANIYRTYWKNINDFNYNIQKNKPNHLNLFRLLFINLDDLDKIVSFNNYLTDEEHYNILRSKITKANVSFKNANAVSLDNEFYKKYDFILLSNILDYFYKIYKDNNIEFNIYELRKYEEKLFKLLKDDFKIFLNYIIYYISSNFKRKYIINNTSINNDILDKEKIYAIDSTYSMYGKNNKDGIVLVKKY